MSDDYWAKAAREARAAYNTRKEADEITRLRADLAAVTAERDRMREALEPFASPPLYVFDRPLKYVPAPMTEDWIGGGWFSTEDFRRARAAIEGVTEKSGVGNE